MPPKPPTSDFVLQASSQTSSRGTALNPTRTVLDNGAILLTKPTHTTPAVTINLAMRAGSVADPAGLPGMAWLLSRVIDRGTATRSGEQIAEELDTRGIALAIGVTRHFFSIV